MIDCAAVTMPEGPTREGGYIYVLHELLADWPDFLAECGAEHHDLFLVGGGAKDLLDVFSHVCGENRIKSSHYGE